MVAGDVSSVMHTCPVGHFCPAGTGSDWQQCSAGTFNNVTGLAQAIECQPCPQGLYCDGRHALQTIFFSYSKDCYHDISYLFICVQELH